MCEQCYRSERRREYNQRKKHRKFTIVLFVIYFMLAIWYASHFAGLTGIILSLLYLSLSTLWFLVYKNDRKRCDKLVLEIMAE